MTQNQINYQRHLEDVRTHGVNESLTRDRDAETKRSNQAREQESERSNRTREAEQERSNRAQEYLKKYDTDRSYDASIYGSDRNYQGRVDAAHINKWGVSPSDISDITQNVVEPAIDKAKEFIQGIDTPGVVSTLATLGNEIVKGMVSPSLATVLPQPKKKGSSSVVGKMRRTSHSPGGGHRKEQFK